MSDVESSLERDKGLALYRAMSKIHGCEARVRKGLSSGEVGFNYWPIEGHEAMSAGAAVALEPDDQLVATYRGLADVVAKGVTLGPYFAELIGRSTGLSKGKAGAMGVSEPVGRDHVDDRHRRRRTADRQRARSWQHRCATSRESSWSASVTVPRASASSTKR